MAASAAVPPARSRATPAEEARWSAATTMPMGAWTVAVPNGSVVMAAMYVAPGLGSVRPRAALRPADGVSRVEEGAGVAPLALEPVEAVGGRVAEVGGDARCEGVDQGERADVAVEGPGALGRHGERDVGQRGERRQRAVGDGDHLGPGGN